MASPETETTQPDPKSSTACKYSLDAQESDATGSETSPSTSSFKMVDPSDPSWQEQELESNLDSLGVAKCARCGLRLPLDPEALEQHSAQCLGNTVYTTTCIVGVDSVKPQVQSLRDGKLEAFLGAECFDLERDEPEEQDVSCLGSRVEGSFEAGFDMYVARCSRCKAKFPVDSDAFEQHTLECSGPTLKLEDFLAGTPAAFDVKPLPAFGSSEWCNTGR